MNWRLSVVTDDLKPSSQSISSDESAVNQLKADNVETTFDDDATAADIDESSMSASSFAVATFSSTLS